MAAAKFCLGDLGMKKIREHLLFHTFTIIALVKIFRQKQNKQIHKVLREAKIQYDQSQKFNN